MRSITADRHSFFKFMVKSIAEKHGLRATFMPKPFPGLTGSGCHAHISVWDKDGTTNMFFDDADEMGLSQQGYNFLGGIMKHAEALPPSPTRPSTPTSASTRRARSRAPPGRPTR